MHDDQADEEYTTLCAKLENPVYPCLSRFDEQHLPTLLVKLQDESLRKLLGKFIGKPYYEDCLLPRVILEAHIVPRVVDGYTDTTFAEPVMRYLLSDQHNLHRRLLSEEDIKCLLGCGSVYTFQFQLWAERYGPNKPSLLARICSVWD